MMHINSLSLSLSLSLSVVFIHYLLQKWATILSQVSVHLGLFLCCVYMYIWTGSLLCSYTEYVSVVYQLPDKQKT